MRIGAAVIISSILVGLIYSSRVRMNWDNIGYSTAVLQFEESDKDVLQRKVFGSIREHCTESQFDLLRGAGRSDFRTIVYDDPESLIELTNTYASRILFVGFAYGLNKIGVPLASCAGYVSILFFIATAMFIYFALCHISGISRWSILLVYLLVLFSPQLEIVGTLSTPDMMSCFALVVSAYAIITRKNVYWLHFCMLLAILVRPDNIVFTGTIGLAALWIYRGKKVFLQYLLGWIFLLGTYFLIVGSIDYPGWRVWFYHSFIEKLNYPLSDPTEVTISEYMSTLVDRLPRFVYPGLVFAAIVYVALLNQPFQKMGDHLKVLLLGSILAVSARICLFPYWDIRFFLPYLLIAILLAFSVMKGKQIQLLS